MNKLLVIILLVIILSGCSQKAVNIPESEEHKEAKEYLGYKPDENPPMHEALDRAVLKIKELQNAR